MSYQIRRAAYANPEMTAAIIDTVEAAAVLISEKDTPDLWKQMLARGEPSPYTTPPSPTPTTISDRQFFQQLAISGDITQDEALAAVKTGAIPAKLQAVIDTLPAGQKFAAVMLISGATVFERGHPMVPLLGAALGKSPADLDALWAAASQI